MGSKQQRRSARHLSEARLWPTVHREPRTARARRRWPEALEHRPGLAHFEFGHQAIRRNQRIGAERKCAKRRHDQLCRGAPTDHRYLATRKRAGHLTVLELAQVVAGDAAFEERDGSGAQCRTDQVHMNHVCNLLGSCARLETNAHRPKIETRRLRHRGSARATQEKHDGDGEHFLHPLASVAAGAGFVQKKRPRRKRFAIPEGGRQMLKSVACRPKTSSNSGKNSRAPPRSSR